jgi:glycerophosphoryl diester phosphodiesterase
MVKTTCIGHRGACGYEPENTLASFERAIQMGCAWVELDVHYVDNELIVIHDSKLDRTTNGTGKIYGRTLAEIQSYDAGNGEHIPTLIEVLDLIDQRVGINVELKGRDTAEPVDRLLSHYCQAGWSKKNFQVSSFDHNELAKCGGDWDRGVLFHEAKPDYFEITARLNAYSINLEKSLVSNVVVDQAHSEGLKVFVYTANDPTEIKELIDMKVDGIITNFPDRV